MTDIRDGYGMGLFRFPYGDKITYGHTGGIDGFNSFLAFFPHDSTAVAFIGNGMNYRMNDFMLGVMDIYYGKNYKMPTFGTVTLKAAELSKYEGTYASKQVPLKITVKKDGGQLTAQATGQSSFPLEPETALSFRFDPAGIVMEFTAGPDGLITGFVLKQRGGVYTFERE